MRKPILLAAFGLLLGSCSDSGGGGDDTYNGFGDCDQDLACELAPPASTGDLHQDCVNRINQFRTQCACLEPLERWRDGEDCADRMAQYDAERDEAHAGFLANLCSGGFAQNECPGWRSSSRVIDGCLQSMWDEGPPPQSSCTGSCFNQHGHFLNMTDPDYGRVACGFFTTPNGEVWAVQNFAP